MSAAGPLARRSAGLGYANMRTDASRSHWRALAAAMKSAMSPISTTPLSLSSFEVLFFKQFLAALVDGNRLHMTKGVTHKIKRAEFLG